MKLKLLIISIFLLVGLTSFGQLDEFDIGPGVGVSINPISTFYNYNSTQVSTTRGNWVLDVDPEYEAKNKMVIASNILFIGYMHVPVINKDNWALGFNSTVGIGVFKAFNGFDEMATLSIELEGNIYYKNQKVLNATEFFIGYKYNDTGLSYKLPIVGIRRDKFEVFASVFRDKYYLKLSNGEDVPTSKIAEIGVKFFF